nr:hypothetical protein [Micromonospora sp. DSM 115978]
MNERVESAAGSTAGTLACPECATATTPADLYCEACGASLCQAASAHRAADRSAAGEAAGDAAGDRTEIDLGQLAGVSDRGLVHESNEDGMAVALRPVPLAVVCDGVSTAPQSGPAA